MKKSGPYLAFSDTTLARVDWEAFHLHNGRSPRLRTQVLLTWMGMGLFLQGLARIEKLFSKSFLSKLSCLLPGPLVRERRLLLRFLFCLFLLAFPGYLFVLLQVCNIWDYKKILGTCHHVVPWSQGL